MALRPPVIPAPEPESPEAHPLRPYVIPTPEPESLEHDLVVCFEILGLWAAAFAEMADPINMI